MIICLRPRVRLQCASAKKARAVPQTAFTRLRSVMTLMPNFVHIRSAVSDMKHWKGHDGPVIMHLMLKVRVYTQTEVCSRLMADGVNKLTCYAEGDDGNNIHTVESLPATTKIKLAVYCHDSRACISIIYNIKYYTL